MAIFAALDTPDDDDIDLVLRYANAAPADLQTLLLGAVVDHLVALGWVPLTAELEVHLRMRQLQL